MEKIERKENQLERQIDKHVAEEKEADAHKKMAADGLERALSPTEEFRNSGRRTGGSKWNGVQNILRRVTAAKAVAALVQGASSSRCDPSPTESSPTATAA